MQKNKNKFKTAMIKAYYLLTKPGIIYGNSLSVIAGFFLASHGNFQPLLFLTTLLGLACIMASGCVFNNYLDRDIDQKMERTKKRALVTKTIPVINALIFGTILGLLGFSTLYIFTNLLTTVVAAIGFFFYVFVYTFSKRKTIYSTLLGSVSGAVPPVVGYVAVSNTFDTAAFLLFLLLVLWQMPHFYAIAIFRHDEYANASLPVLSVKRGMHVTKTHILFYILVFTLVAPLLTIFGYTGYLYLAGMLLLTLIWLWKGLHGFRTANNVIWARGMFKFSLIVLLGFCLLLSINSV